MCKDLCGRPVYSAADCIYYTQLWLSALCPVPVDTTLALSTTTCAADGSHKSVGLAGLTAGLTVAERCYLAAGRWYARAADAGGWLGVILLHTA
jgi:hypothetical protein